MDFANYSQWSTVRMKGASERLNQMLGFWVGPKRRDRRWEVTGVARGGRSRGTFWQQEKAVSWAMARRAQEWQRHWGRESHGRSHPKGKGEEKRTRKRKEDFLEEVSVGLANADNW